MHASLLLFPFPSLCSLCRARKQHFGIISVSSRNTHLRLFFGVRIGDQSITEVILRARTTIKDLSNGKLDALPQEVLEQAVRKLDLVALRNVRLVSRYLNAVVEPLAFSVTI
jgi:hypothetical protein